jgi:F-type H+-transporting ATPase subunit epsilon
MADTQTGQGAHFEPESDFAAGRIKVRVVTPERILVDTDATMITMPGEAGVLAAGPGSAPQLTAIGAGDLIIAGGDAGGEQKFVVARGFAEILPDRVTVLVEYAEVPDKVDKAAAETLLKEGEKAEQDAGQDPAKYSAARRTVLEAEAKLGRPGQ